jgi:hypothetical protein
MRVGVRSLSEELRDSQLCASSLRLVKAVVLVRVVYSLWLKGLL